MNRSAALAVLVLLVRCSVPEPVAIVRGELSPGLAACTSAATCGDAGVCTAYDAADGGSFCGSQPCAGLICPESAECLCLWTNPPRCGCSARR